MASAKRTQPWSTFVLVTLLAGYWVAMFVSTHVPTLPIALPGQSDKTVHLTAFCGLASLLMAWQCSRGQVGLSHLLLMWLMLAGYGVVDEVTQPIVGRVCDLHDWLSDLLGATIGLAATWPLASRLFRTSSAGQ